MILDLRRFLVLLLSFVVVFSLFALPCFAWGAANSQQGEVRTNLISPHTISFSSPTYGGSGTTWSFSVPIWTPANFPSSSTLTSSFFDSRFNQTRSLSWNKVRTPLVTDGGVSDAVSWSSYQGNVNINSVTDSWVIQFSFDNFYLPYSVDEEASLEFIAEGSPIPYFIFAVNRSNSSPVNMTVSYSWTGTQLASTVPASVVTSPDSFSYTEPLLFDSNSDGLSSFGSGGWNAVRLVPAGIRDILVQDLICTISFDVNPGNGWSFETYGGSGYRNFRLLWPVNSANLVEVNSSNYSFDPVNFYVDHDIRFAGLSSDGDSVTDFLGSSINSFMGFEIFPGFSLGIVITALVSLTLLVAFLKVFAGG